MKQKEKTYKLLLSHYNSHKKMEIQDIFKYLYQSTFGCEHMISSKDAVIRKITEEYDNIITDSSLNIEYLDGEYSRVPLAWLNYGISIDTLGKLFYLSSLKESGNREDLIEKLMVTQELIHKQLLPFSPESFNKELKEWEIKNYPSLHHSDIFKAEYKPAYRVISNYYIKLNLSLV